ncbi:MAG: ABC transporter ATP-binding protein [Myxococcota bacterium]
MTDVAIRFEHVSHVYVQPGARSFAALSELSFSIGAGEFVAILGRSGSGKSTLLNLIAGFDRACTGHVRVGGARLDTLSESQLTAWRGRHVGVVFQFFQLLPTLTVEENLVLAMEFVGTIPKRSRRERAHELLAAVGVDDQARKLPGQLSGGQQQRVAVARALVNQPEIIIADEPTGNLDSASAAGVLDLFDSLRDREVTLVVVTHDELVARRADRVLHIDDGRLIPTPTEHVDGAAR